MGWMYVLIGGIFEIGWAIGLKYSVGFTVLWPSVFTAICLAISFYLFAKSMQALPAGTAYAVYTGIGSAGTAIIGMLVMDEPVGVARLFFLSLLIGGMIGLKMIGEERVETTTSESETQTQTQVQAEKG